MTRTNPRLLLSLILSGILLGGCERLGIPDFTKSSANAEADGKAIGSACRHAGRAIEDCYNLNPSAQRAAVFAGWREMNDYMAENKIAEVAPQGARYPGTWMRRRAITYSFASRRVTGSAMRARFSR